MDDLTSRALSFDRRAHRRCLGDPDIEPALDEPESDRGATVIDEAPLPSVPGRIGDDGGPVGPGGARGDGNLMHARLQRAGIVNVEQRIYGDEGCRAPDRPSDIARVPAIDGSVVRRLPRWGGGPGTLLTGGIVCACCPFRGGPDA
ncbi:hypothetical protein [Burkholderia sp. ABCPW 14]|uniref:hypothetical protein n=1 Tax=Burkholderia sp. ABCPW 14 TaxID=1637860 RepID=UPI0018D200DC|nr:hypothetical protein [Burkholderia sp. ABCPW 14]